MYMNYTPYRGFVKYLIIVETRRLFSTSLRDHYSVMCQFPVRVYPRLDEGWWKLRLLPFLFTVMWSYISWKAIWSSFM